MSGSSPITPHGRLHKDANDGGYWLIEPDGQAYEVCTAGSALAMALDSALSAHSETAPSPADPVAASTHGLLNAARDLLAAHGDRNTAEMIERSKRIIPNVPVYRSTTS